MTVRVRLCSLGWLQVGRMFFLLAGTASLGYAAWVLADQYAHQRRMAESFEQSRHESGPNPLRAVVDQRAFPARLTIARLGVSVMIEEGVTFGILRRSAGHIPGTAVPGQLGNVGVAAHRDTLFRGLKDIRKADLIQVSTITKEFKYQVTDILIVNPTDVGVLSPSEGRNTLTLVTCYPFNFIGNAPRRFIVQATQVGELAAK